MNGRLFVAPRRIVSGIHYMKHLLPCVALCSLAVTGLHATDDLPALKDLFAGKFLIGTAIGADVVMQPGHPLRPLVEKHFNAITPGNLLKWGPYNPQPGEYNEADAEAFFAYGRAHKQFIVGHCLFWHSQTPRWVFEDGKGGQASRDLLLRRMRERVRHLSKLYGDRTDAWDVINETFLDDGTLRNSPFTRILGPDFVAEAFRLAQEELPASVRLIYNDYNMEAPGKIEAVVKMIHDLRAKGLRIDAVGSQAHWRLETPTIAEIERSIVALHDTGVKVHFTELDVEVLPRTVNGAEVSARASLTPESNPYTTGLPAEIQKKLAKRYADLFALFLKHADAIDRVTFWGVTDRDSWLNNWPVRGRTNYPLLFDRDGRPKPAFHAVAATASRQ
jgi:endo-1,4-beta-xylanase